MGFGLPTCNHRLAIHSAPAAARGRGGADWRHNQYTTRSHVVLSLARRVMSNASNPQAAETANRPALLVAYNFEIR